MHLVYFLVFSAIMVATLGDCGCLKCSKHLRVISPPGAPVTIIERGDACLCPKPFPYNVEIPMPPCPRPRKDYGYRVQEVKYRQPCDPMLSQHAYRVDIPCIPAPKPHVPLQGLARVDRIVVPAKDECVPPKSNCCNDPDIEYILPACCSQCCDNRCVYYSGCYRRKRDLYQDRYPAHTKIDWNSKISPPKSDRSLKAKNLWERHAKPAVLPAKNHQNLFDRYRSYSKSNVPTRKVIQEKPIRFNIPLTQNNNFFPSRNFKTKRKIQPSNPFVEYPVEINTQPDKGAKSIRSKTLTKLLRKSGKFADVENVKIAYGTPTRYRQKFKTENQHGARKIRSATFKETTNRIGGDNSEGNDQFRENFGEDPIDNLVIKNRFLTPSKQDRVSYVLDTPTRMVNHLNRMKDYVRPMVHSIPEVLGTSTNYIKDFSKRFGRGTVDFFRDFIGNVKGLPRMMLKGVLAPYKRNKRNIAKEDMNTNNFGKFTLEETSKLKLKPFDLTDHHIIAEDVGYNLDDQKISTSSLLGESNRDFPSTISYRIVQNEIDYILNQIKQLNGEEFDVEEQIFKDLSKLQFQKNSFIRILKDIVSKGKVEDPNMKTTVVKMIQTILSSKQDLTRRIGEILASKTNFASGNMLVKELVILEKLHWVLTKLFEDLSGDTNKILEDTKYLDQLCVMQKSTSQIRNMLRKNRDSQTEKEFMISDRLQVILGRKESIDCINRIAETIWQMNYCKKLLKNTVFEMNQNIENDLTTAREARVIFDLEKQMELCQNKLFDSLKDVS